MIKHKYSIFSFLLAVSAIVGFSACSSDNDTGIDLDWKVYNEQLFSNAKASGDYTREWTSYSGNGYVLAKSTDKFVPVEETKSTKITSSGTPTFTDSVVCRYEGWYYLKDGKKQIFDSTESTNKQQGVGFRLNGVIDGWATALQNMREGDAYQICIPQRLAYGATTKYDQSTGAVSIPAYTTLWFDIKLVKIIPLNPNEFN